MKRIGFSLLEIILYVFFLSTVMLGVFLFVPELLKVRSEGAFQSQKQHQKMWTTQVLGDAIRMAEIIQEPHSGQSSSQLKLTSKGRSLLFFESEGLLWKKIDTEEPVPLTSRAVQVSDFQVFHRSGLVEVSFFLQPLIGTDSTRTLKREYFSFSFSPRRLP